MTTIGLRLWDGYLSFDGERIDQHDENLASWLENVSPEDLLRGDYRFEVEVEVAWDVDGPTLHHITVKENE